jgi:hypothetical protein
VDETLARLMDRHYRRLACSRSPAAGEHPANRRLNPYHSFRLVTAHRGLSAGPARTWYIDGNNIKIEYRYADGKTDRLTAIAAELVELKLDIIVAANNNVARSVSSLTKTIPIVL